MHFPEPNSPKSSVIAWLSNPFPPKSSLKLFDPVVMEPTLDRRSNNAAPDSKLPMSAAFRAARIIFVAVGSPISAISASSFGDATAMLIRSSKPDSLSFSAIVGPTPGSEVISSLSIKVNLKRSRNAQTLFK